VAEAPEAVGWCGVFIGRGRLEARSVSPDDALPDKSLPQALQSVHREA